VGWRRQKASLLNSFSVATQNQARGEYGPRAHTHTAQKEEEEEEEEEGWKTRRRIFVGTEGRA
tara:strand:- start:386 stop:574 length:189 start_codon:yes stop_codon:yes gene_type:complete